MFVWTLGFVEVNDCTRKKAAWGMGRTRSWMVSILMFLNEFSSCVFQWSSHSVSWVQYQMSLEVLKSLGHRLTDPCFARSLQYPPVTACHGDGKSRKERPCFYGTIIKWESPWPLPCKWLAEASLFHTFKGFIFHPYTIQTCAGGKSIFTMANVSGMWRFMFNQ